MTLGDIIQDKLEIQEEINRLKQLNSEEAETKRLEEQEEKNRKEAIRNRDKELKEISDRRKDSQIANALELEKQELKEKSTQASFERVKEGGIGIGILLGAAVLIYLAIIVNKKSTSSVEVSQLSWKSLTEEELQLLNDKIGV
jgi:hypothetical protein